MLRVSSGGVMNNPVPGGVVTNQPQENSGCGRSDSYVVFGIGVVLLIFGRGLFGFQQAPLVGLALIVFSHYLD
jgi:hypothetical protein